MGNRIVVMDGDRKVIGRMSNGLACFAVVNEIVKKYNGESLPLSGDVNAALAKVYEKCEGYEEVQLLLFINDKSSFGQSDIPRFNQALEKWTFANDNPKRHIEFIRDLLSENDKVITEYEGVTTAAVTVSTASDKH